MAENTVEALVLMALCCMAAEQWLAGRGLCGRHRSGACQFDTSAAGHAGQAG
ncbi:hypothetical protein [Lampropedia aestuarii]|uniref:hypothetical protein n=1 Tax=Lampropedia aestuarii TaxID=2562762 RepID=UPI001455FD18|nr:hypothetical protein [Lampropedia aestuarii]